jgi:hypothetical protein
MKIVAGQLGISARRLAKICERFKIPFPPESDWARTPRVRNAPVLPPVRTSASETITVTSPRAPLSPETPRDTHHEALGPSSTATSEGPYHPQLNEWLRHFQLWRQRIDARLRDEPFPSDLLREVRLLDRIFRAAQRKGLIPKVKKIDTLRYVEFLYEGVPISCELRDTKSLVTVKSFGVERREFRYTGKRLFGIKNVFARALPVKTEWHEKQVGPLSKQVDAIVDALVLAGPVVVRNNNERLERRQRWDDDQQEIRRQKEAARRDASYRRALFRAATHHSMAVKLRELVSALEAAEHDHSVIIGGRSITEWFTWTKSQMTLLDPLSGGALAFFRRIHEVDK